MRLPAPQGFTDMRTAIDGVGRNLFGPTWDGTEFDAREGMLSPDAAQAEITKREEAERKRAERQAADGLLSAYRVSGAYNPQPASPRRRVLLPPLRQDEDPTSAAYQAERDARIRFEEAAATLRQHLFDGGRRALGRTPMGPLEPFPTNFWLQDEAADVLELGKWFDGECQQPVYVSAEQPPANRGGAPGKADWEAIEEAFKREVRERGLPDSLNVDGWQRQADVERWIAAQPGVDVSETTLKNRARTFLNRARAET